MNYLAQVKFDGSKKKYAYKVSFDLVLEPGDVVSVDTRAGIKEARVVSIHEHNFDNRVIGEKAKQFILNKKDK